MTTARRQTLDQYSKDMAAFLMWAAEPHMVQRKRIGFQVMVFLIVLAGLMYFTKKKVWTVEKPREIGRGRTRGRRSSASFGNLVHARALF